MGYIGKDIIDNQEIEAAIDQAAKDVMRLKETIADVNRQTMVIKVEWQGAEGLQQIDSNVKNVMQQLKALTDVSAGQVAIQEKWGEATIANISTLTDQRNELRLVQAELKNLIKTDSSAAESIDRLSQAELDLKIAISNTTSGIKSQIKENQAAAGSMDEISQKLFQMKERYRALSEAERENAAVGGRLNSQITELDDKIKLLDSRLGNHQRNVGNYAKETKIMGMSVEQASTRFASMAFRMIALQTFFLPLIAAVSDLGTVFLSLIPGTDAFIQRQQKIISENDALKTSFDELSDSMVKMLELEHKLLEDEIKQSTGIDLTIRAYKDKENAIKALGVTDRAIYEAETNQFIAAQKTREIERQDLESKYNTLKRVQDIVGDISKSTVKADGGLWSDILATFKTSDNVDPRSRGNAAIATIQKSELPSEFKDKLILAMQKAKSENADILKALEAEFNKYSSNTIDAYNALDEKKKEIENAAVKRQADINRLISDKNRELNIDLSKMHEQLRQVNEKEDIASLDKIVTDTRAKYKLLADEIRRNKETYRLTVTTKDDVSYTDKNIEAYNNLLRVLKLVGEQEKNNAIYELEKQQHAQYLTNQTNLSGGKAAISKSNASFGLMSYDKSAAAIDAETEFKKTALKNQFYQLASTINDSDQIIEAQRQLDEKLKQIDKEAYKERLKLVEDYFNQVAQKIDKSTTSLQTENSIRSLNNLTSIFNRRGSIAGQDMRIFLEEQERIKTNANIGLAGIAEKRGPLQESFNKADNATKGPLSPDALEEANKVKAALKKNLDDLAHSEADYNEQIAAADNAIWRKKKEQLENIKDLSIQLAQETMSAIKTIQDNQFEHERQQLEIKQRQVEIERDQKLAAIDATTGFAIQKDNEKAKVEAQTAAIEASLQHKSNEIALKKAIADKQAAQDAILMNTAIAISRATILLAEVATAPYGIAEIALITAIGAAQYAAASSTPLPQFEMGGTTETPFFIAAEGNKSEMMVTPSGNIMLAQKEGVYQAEIGTKIYNHSDTQKMITDMFSLQGNLWALKERNEQIISTRKIEEKLDSLIDVQYAGIMKTQQININNIVRSYNPLQRKQYGA